MFIRDVYCFLFRFFFVLVLVVCVLVCVCVYFCLWVRTRRCSGFRAQRFRMLRVWARGL